MDRDANDLGKWLRRRRSLQEVFIPVGNVPFGWCCARQACQSQSRRQHMLAEAGMGILGIKGIEKKRQLGLYRPHFPGMIQARSNTHFSGNPRGCHFNLLEGGQSAGRDAELLCNSKFLAKSRTDCRPDPVKQTTKTSKFGTLGNSSITLRYKA